MKNNSNIVEASHAIAIGERNIVYGHHSILIGKDLETEESYKLIIKFNPISIGISREEEPEIDINETISEREYHLISAAIKATMNLYLPCRSDKTLYKSNSDRELETKNDDENEIIVTKDGIISGKAYAIIDQRNDEVKMISLSRAHVGDFSTTHNMNMKGMSINNMWGTGRIYFKNKSSDESDIIGTGFAVIDTKNNEVKMISLNDYLSMRQYVTNERFKIVDIEFKRESLPYTYNPR